MFSSALILAALSLVSASPLEKRVATSPFSDLNCPPNMAIESSSYMTYKIVPKNNKVKKNCEDECTATPGCISYNYFLDNNAQNKPVNPNNGVATSYTCSLFNQAVTSMQATNAGLKASTSRGIDGITASSCFSLTVTPTCGDPAAAVPFYSGFNSDSASYEHIYSTDLSVVSAAPFTPTGAIGKIFNYPAPGTIPLYLIHSNVQTDGAYTISQSEVDIGVNNLAYTNKGTVGYVYASDQCGGQLLNRWYSGVHRDHFYTLAADAAPDGSYVYESNDPRFGKVFILPA